MTEVIEILNYFENTYVNDMAKRIIHRNGPLTRC